MNNQSWYQKLLQRMGFAGQGEAITSETVTQETQKTIRWGKWVFWRLGRLFIVGSLCSTGCGGAG